jgi:DNA-binding NarL/FixJ family response regulator
MNRQLETIQVGIAEDHPVYRNGLKNLLASEKHLNVLFDVSNGTELMEQLRFFQPQILIIDVRIPFIDGINATKIIKQNYPNICVIINSNYCDTQTINDAAASGARAFLSKKSEFTVMVDAIENVYDLGYSFDSDFTPELITLCCQENKTITLREAYAKSLSHREVDVLKLICDGLSSSQIADILCISNRTVENHRRNLFEKTKAKNMADLTVYAIKNGYFSIQG